jgi:hypothetical protein
LGLGKVFSGLHQTAVGTRNSVAASTSSFNSKAKTLLSWRTSGPMENTDTQTPSMSGEISVINRNMEYSVVSELKGDEQVFGAKETL